MGELIDIRSTTQHIDNYDVKYTLCEKAIAPQTYAMYWCMFATGIKRIFTTDHLKEFFFRLAITMDSLHLVENWFTYDDFLTFSIGDKNYTLSPEDVYQHLGMENLDSYEDMMSRADYLESVGRLIGNAQLIGELCGGFQVISPKIIKEEKDPEDDTYEIEFTDDDVEITGEIIRKAEFFAGDVLKSFNPALYKAKSTVSQKMVELEERRRKMENLPKFSLSMIPTNVQQKCLYLMFNEEYVANLLNITSREEYEKKVTRYFYLAWLVANDFLWFDDEGNFNHCEGLVFNPLDYDEDCGFDIQRFYDDYCMSECEEFLKGIGV